MPRSKRATSVTPWMQWMILCEAVKANDDGIISFSNLFDSITANALPGLLECTISVQYRGGQGEHKHWLRVIPPEGEERDTDEVSFWLASKAMTHRLDARLRIGILYEGKYDFATILDGREVARISLQVTSLASSS